MMETAGGSGNVTSERQTGSSTANGPRPQGSDTETSPQVNSQLLRFIGGLNLWQEAEKSEVAVLLSLVNAGTKCLNTGHVSLIQELIRLQTVPDTQM